MRLYFLSFFLLGSFLLRGQAPTITSFTPGKVCQGETIVITGTNFTNASVVKLGTGDAASFTVNSATKITVVAGAATTGIISVTTPGGVANSVDQVTILAAPVPVLTDKSTKDEPFTNCDGNSIYQLVVSNSSTPGGGSSLYTINWGDGSAQFSQRDWPVNAQTSHTYSNQGYFTIVFRIEPENGCTRTFTHKFYNGANPLAGLTTTHPTTGLCTPASIEFQISNWFDNSAGTVYQVEFGDGSPDTVLKHPLNAGNTIQLLSHLYTRSSCPNIDFTAKLYAVNGCYTTLYTLNQIVVRKKPTADFQFEPEPACINNPVCFTNLTTDGYSGNSCNRNTDYLWDFGDGSTTTAESPGCHTYTAAGTYTVTLTASNTTCGSDIKTRQVKVIPLSPLPTVTTPINYCVGASAVPLKATGTGLLWYTVATGGTDSPTAPTPSTATAGTNTWYVSQTLPNSCESPRVPVTVTIHEAPAAPLVITPLQLCLNQPAAPLTATGSALVWYTSPTGGTGTPTAPTPVTSVIGSTNYYVSQTTNSCEGLRAIIVVTVNALATAPQVVTPVIYCQGQNADPLTAGGSSLLWYTSATGGTGSPNAPVPATGTVGSTIYYVSQVTGCGEGPRAAITVDIRAAPSATISYDKTNLCNSPDLSGSPNGPVNVILAGTTGGVFSIIPSTGLPINPATGTLSPAGAEAGNYTIHYTITGSGGCSDFSTTTSVSVSGTPEATATYPPICSADGPTAPTVTGIGGGTFSSTAGLIIDPSTGSISPGTSTPGTYTVTYTIAATAPCPGFTTTTSLTISKAPAATIAYSLTNICNVTDETGTPNPPIKVTLTGTPGGSFSISPSTGLPIDASTGTLTPSGAVTGTYTIQYTVKGTGGCSEVSTTTSVTVSGAPTAEISYPPICSADGPTAPTVTGTGGGTFSSTAGLIIDQATGNINPGTSTPGIYTVTYTIAATAPCPGFTTTTSVTITKAPAATIAYSLINICNVTDETGTPNPPIKVTLTGTPGGSFTISPGAGLPIDAATGTLTPSGAVAGTYTIQYTVKGTGGCAEVSTTTSVTVTGSPTAEISYSPICTADGPTAPTVTGTRGGAFTSTTGLVIDPATGNITPGTSTPAAYTVTYTIAATAPCPGFTTTASVTITQAPSATIAYSLINICNVTDETGIPNPPLPVTLTGTPGGSFSITPATGLPIDASTGTLTPSGAATGTYTIQYKVTGTGGCTEFITTATVTVSGAPTAAITYPVALCTSDAPAAAQVTGTQGGEFTAAAGLAIDPISGTITPASSTPGTYTVTYTIKATAPCPGFTTTTSIIITKAPNAGISYAASNLCNVGNTPSTPNPAVDIILTGDAGGTYSVLPATGLTINTTTGTLDPSGAVPGDYTITYTLPGGAGCSGFTTTTAVTVSGAPVATINYPASPYCGGITTAQPVVFSGTTGGTFSSAQGLLIDAATGSITPASSQPGTYTVTYTIEASAPCPGYIATAIVTIDESPVLTFSVSSQPICSGGTADFRPSSTVANTTYAWSVTGPLPAGVSGITTGSAAGPGAVISLSFTNTGSSSQSIDIEVVPTNPSQNPCPGPPYHLTLVVNPIPAALATDTFHLCMGAPPLVLTAVPAPGNTVNWYDQSLVKLNTAPVITTGTPAQFDFYVSQSSGAGCESPKSKVVAIVHPTPKIVSSSYTNPTICGVASGSIILNVLDLNGNPIPNTAVLVHHDKFQVPYEVVDSTDAAGTITVPLVAGTYSGIYVSTFGCASQPISDIFVLKDPDPPVKPVAGYNPPLCSETPLHLTAATPTSSQAGPIDYVWAGPAFGAMADTTENTYFDFPSATLVDAGTYIVYAIQNNCISDPASFQVVIKQSPAKPVINTRTPLCIGDALSLQAVSSIPGNNTISYTWTGPGRGFPVNAANAGISNIQLSDAGIYSVTVSSPQTGCSSSTDTLIQVGGYPIVKFSPDSLTLPTGYLLPLNPVITNAGSPGILPMQKYEWTPSQDLQCNDAACSLPIATIKNNICYSVKATNVFGCSGTDEICIRVFCKNSQVFIPNAFTPRGGLSENAILMVRASGIAAVKSFRVFNRWGKLVFEKNNFPPNDPAFGWNGIVSGKLVDAGVYVYTTEVVCENGVPYSYHGNVTVF